MEGSMVELNVALTNLGRDDDDTISAYMDINNLATTTVTTAGNWYVINSAFINSFGKYWEAGTTGIKRKSTAPTRKFELEFMVGGQCDEAGDVKIAMVKNGTFTSGELTTGSIIPGSGGKDFADLAVQTGGEGEVNPRCFCPPIELEAGDEITLVITAAVSGAIFTPDGGSASAHQVK